MNKRMSNGLPASQDLYYEAVQAALQIEEPAETVNTLLQIVRSLDSIGDRATHRDYAFALLPKILTRIHELQDERERAYLLRLFIKLQCDLGAVRNAEATLSYLDFDADQKALALRDLAVAQAREGRLTDALATTGDIEDLDDYESVLEAIGEFQAAGRRFVETMQTAGKIEAGESRCRLLRCLAREQWNAGRHADALQTLRSILAVVRSLNEEAVKDPILSETVCSFTGIHRIFDAMSLAKEIADPVLRIDAFCSIVVFLQQSGNASGGRSAADEATVAARRISEPMDRARALERVGEALHRIGDVEESKEIFREALSSVKRIGNAYSQARQMIDFGLKLTELGMPDVAKKVFRLAIESTQTIEDVSFRFPGLVKILDAQASTSLVAEAEKTLAMLDEIRDELPKREIVEGTFDRDLALCRGMIGSALFANDLPERAKKRFEEGIGISRSIFDPLNRSTSLFFLAERLAAHPMPGESD